MHHARHHDPRRCILPPHILAQIAQNGSPKQRKNAIDTLLTDHTIRTLRITHLQQPFARALPGYVRAIPKVHRTIYSARHEEVLPGTAVRAEGDKPVDDPAVNEAYDGLGTTFDFYFQVLHRDSIDDRGLPLDASVHYGRDYDNAYWDGERMVFGDGDGEIFNRFTISLDVIGHELTHGVTGAEANLRYMGQAGALNESMSDVFGSLIKQWHLQQPVDQADWLIGEGLLAKGVQGVALRSMKDPGSAYDDPVLGKDPQPGHMRDYVHSVQDNGGVHINSGIPNHAFYLAATAIGGLAWDAPGHIWYEALRDPHLRTNSGFTSFARRTIANAGELYGAGSVEQKAVREAWTAVGVRI